MSCALQMLSLSVRVSLKRTDKSKIVFVVSELNFLGIVKKSFSAKRYDVHVVDAPLLR